MDETVTLRAPKDKLERMIAGCRSTYEDLFFDEISNRMIVTGKNAEGERLYLGEVSLMLLYVNGVNVGKILGQIRFGG